MATEAKTLRDEFAKRIGIYYQGEVSWITGNQFTLSTYEADGYYVNCWALYMYSDEGTEYDVERRIVDYTSGVFTVQPDWGSIAPSVGSELRIMQFRPSVLFDVLSWATGDVFPEASILLVEELSTEADNAYMLPAGMMSLSDVEYKTTGQSGAFPYWIPVEFRLIGDGKQFELLEPVPVGATLRVRGRAPLTSTISGPDTVIEIDFPQTEILYAAAALRLYERASQLVPELTSGQVDKGLLYWRRKLIDARRKHGREKAVLRAKIPVL